MPRPPYELLILGADGMNRADPTPFVRGADGEPWPFLELVNIDVTELPVLQGRLAFRDATGDSVTTFPRQKYGV